MHDTAIGLVHVGLSGDATANRAIIDDLARAEALQVAEIVTIDHGTYMPITYIVSAAARAKADTVVAPDLEHSGSATPR